MESKILSSLRDAIGSGTKPLIICGAGVTIHATQNKAPSWQGLIEDGIEQVLSLNAEDTTWGDYAKSRLKRHDITQWLAVADEVTEHLGGQSGSEFANWLNRKVGHLKCADKSLIDAIVSLGCPIATTNYDTILTQVTGKPPISWDDYGSAVRHVKGDLDGILHLHGIVTKPESVILGTTSYDKLNNDSNHSLARAFQALFSEVVFIGCSLDGVTDTDFSNINAVVERLASAAERRYWLMKKPNTPSMSDPVNRIYPVIFGENHEDLTLFVKQLAAENTTSAVSSANLKSFIELVEPKKRIFGRDIELEKITSTLLIGGHAVISGSPGIGKTSLAVKALYDDRVIDAFQDFRLFVSLENQKHPQSIFTAAVEAAGLTYDQDEASAIRKLKVFCEDKKVVILFDNAEDVLQADFLSAEKAFSILGQIPNLSLVITMRGITPSIYNSYTISNLQKLDESAALLAFNKESGINHKSTNESLNKLLNALDGHALSIHLMAANSREAPSLDYLLTRWNESKASILLRSGQTEHRLTSVRASLALSLKSKSFLKDPLSKRLLIFLANLPDGLTEKACARLLSSASSISKARAVKALSVLTQLKLVDIKLDGRARMLNPLRECIKIDYPINQKAVIRLVDLYSPIIIPNSATYGSLEAYENALTEPLNIESIVELSVDTFGPNQNNLDLVMGVAGFFQKSGRAINPYLETAAEAFAQASMFLEAAQIFTKIALTEYMRGNVEKSLFLYNKAEPYTRLHTNNPVRSVTLHGFGLVYRSKGQFAEAITKFQQAKKAAEVMSNPNLYCIANSVYGLASIARAQGRIEEAKSLLDEATKLTEKTGDKLTLSNIKNAQVFIDDTNAITLLDEALDLIKDHSLGASASMIHITYGDYYFRRGNAERALSMYELAEKIANAGGFAANEAMAHIRVGQTLLALGRHNLGVQQVYNGFELWFATSMSDNPARQGFKYMRDALTAQSPSQAFALATNAAEAWRSVDRLDLIQEWVDFRFGSITE